MLRNGRTGALAALLLAFTLLCAPLSLAAARAVPVATSFPTTVAADTDADAVGKTGFRSALGSRFSVESDGTVTAPGLTLIDATRAPYSCLANGTAQATTCLQNALNAAAASAGAFNGVYLGGRFRFNSGTVTVPRGIALVGSLRSLHSHTGLIDFGTGPSMARNNQPVPTDPTSTTIMVDTGAGSAAGCFITMKLNTLVRGFSMYWPSQPQTASSPTAYPWGICTDGDSSTGATGYNMTVEDVELVNPYQGIYAHAGGRIHIRNIFGQPIAAGIYFDKVYDSSRVEDVQFTLSWSSPLVGGAHANIFRWSLANGYGIKLGRVDNIFITRTFVLGMRHGVSFVDTPNEPYGAITLLGGGPWATISDSGFGDGGHTGMHLSATYPRTIGGLNYVRIKVTNTDFNASEYGVYVAAPFNGDLQISNSHWASANTQNFNIYSAGSPILTLTGNDFNDWTTASIASAFVNNPALSPNAIIPQFVIAGNNFPPNKANAYAFSGPVTGISGGNNFGGSYTTAMNNTSSLAFHSAGDRFGVQASVFSGLVGGTTGKVAVSALGNVVLGPLENSPLSTGATTGHVFLPKVEGAPTGTPAQPSSHAAVVIDATNKKICFNTGSAWYCAAATPVP